MKQQRAPHPTPLIVFSAVLFAGLTGLSGAWAQTAEAPPDPLWTDVPVVEPLADDAPLRANTFRNLAEALLPTVVTVLTEGPLHDHGPGTEAHRKKGKATGIVVHSSGWIVTNQHVVADKELVHVVLYDGQRLRADIHAADEATDLALLRVRGTDLELKAAPLGDSHSLRVGDWVMAIGNPLGLPHTTTAGIVSAVRRQAIKLREEHQYRLFVQTDAFINKGSSGGPLIDTAGRVVGINTGVRHEVITFAIPAEILKTMLPRLAAQKHRRSRLGATVKSMTHDDAERLNLRTNRGALVTAIARQSPAKKAGLRKNDVITRFDGEPVFGSDDLLWFASVAALDREVEIEIIRGGESRVIQTQLEPAKKVRSLVHRFQQPKLSEATEAKPAAPTKPPPAVQRAAPISAESLGLRFEKNGPLVLVDVDAKSFAGKAGARRGDRVMKANGAVVSTRAALEKAINAAASSDQLALIVERDGNQYYLPVEMP